MELASLAISVDSRSARRATTDLDGLTRASERTEKAVGNQRGANERMARSSDQAARAMDGQSRAAANLTRSIRAYATVALSAFSVAAIARYADGWSDMQSVVGAAIKDMEAAPRMMRRIVDVANASYSPLQQTVDIYARNVVVLRELGVSAEGAADFTESLNNMLVITATRGQRATSVQEALSKAMAVGRMQADGLEAVLANGGRVAEALAKELGTTVNGLRDMATQGKITSDVIANALIGSLQEVRDEAAKMPATISDAFTRVGTNVTELVGRLDKATGASSSLAEKILALADGIRASGDFVVRFAELAAPAFSMVAEAASIAVVALAGFYAPALIAGIATLTTALGVGLVGAIRAVTAAMMANPIGLIFAAASTAVYVFRDDIQKVLGGDVLSIIAGVGGAFRAVMDNVGIIFRNSLNAMREQVSEWAMTIADGLNNLFGTNIETSLWVGPEPEKVRDVAAAFREARDAYAAASKAEVEATRATEAGTKARAAAAKATGAAAKAQQAFERSRRQYLNGLYGEISAMNEQAKGLEEQIALYGLAESAKYDLAIADLEAQQAALAVIDTGAEEIAILERKIELLHQMKGSQQTLERLDAEKQAWETWSRDVEQIFQQVGQSLTDALFEGGKSGRDLIKDLFKTLTLRVLIQPVMGGLQGLFMGAGPAGIANAGSAAGGMMGSPTSLFSMFGGNSMGMGISNALTGLSSSSMLAGTGVGNWMTGVAGNVAGMSNLALGGAGLLGGLGANLIFGGKGHSGIGGGLGSTVGMALGGPIGAVAGTLIGGGLGSLFGDREPTTRREQRTQVEYAGGLFDITKVDDRAPAGADAAARALAEQAVQTANDIFRQVGVDAAIDSFHAIMASSYAGDRDGVASGGRLRIGDEYRQFGIANEGNPTIQGFGGWSSAETLPRLATDIQLSVLEAFQSLSDELPSVLSDMLEGIDIRSLGEQEAQALAERFTMLTQGASQFLAAIETMPFEQLRDLSFDAAAGMVQFAGGIDNLLSAQQTYYERFYSDAERHGHAVDQLTQALAGVGVEMPALVGGTDDMLASYRALVESLDLNTEAGQQAYVTLMQTAGAFADVAEFAGQAAVEAARYAEQVLRERYGLETQLLQLQGNTIELRRRELEALDESNRALQLRIWALQDQKLAEQEAARRAAEIQRLASAERRDVIAARRAAEQAEREAFDAAVKSYEDGAKAFDELRQTLLSAGDAAGLLGATIERALSNPTGKYMAGGVEYDQPRWGADTTAAGFNYDWGVMQMRLARDLSDDISANALRIENAGAALRDLSPNLGEYSPVVGPLAQALTAAVVDASGDIGYAVRDSVYQAMLGVAQQDVYSQFASQGSGLADIRYAQQQAGFASQAGWVAGMGMQFGADVVAYGNAVDKLSGRLRSGQITTEQYESAVDALNRTMPTAAELLGDTEAQLQRMADAAHAVAMAGARSIDHYFGSLRQMAAELEKTEEPINKATAAIGRMNSWVSAFGESAQAAGEYSKRTGEAALIADAAGIAASVLTTADARAAAEKLAQDAAFAGVEGAALRDMSLLVDGIKAFDPDSWERSMIRMSDALGQGVIDEGQFAALFNYSLDVFEDTERATEQLRASFDQLRKAAGSLADELLLDRNLTTLSFGQQYSEAQRQYQEVMRRAMGGDVDAAYDLDRVTRGFLDRSADSRDEIQYRRDFAVAVNNLRQIETSNPMKEMATEIKRLNQEVEGLRADLRAANATVASNTNETTRELRRINATGIKVQA